MHDFASNITYNVVERKKLRKKASETVFNAGVTTTNDSSRVLHSILDFLTDCAESERAKVTWCVNLLTATKWWKELTRREEALQLKLDHLQGLCKPPA